MDKSGPASRLPARVGGRMESDAAYFERRAREERAAALKALHPEARKAHIELAGRYDELAGAIARPNPRRELAV